MTFPTIPSRIRRHFQNSTFPPVVVYRKYVIDSVVIVRNSGFKELIRKRGWKFLAVIVSYYVVRDSVLYIVIPYCVALGIL
jgi:hypothetical protein